MADQPDPDVAQLLARAVEGLGGEPREGQLEMAQAVATAMSGGRHLLVQAGTGTGKSLAYLVPALHHTMSDDDSGPVVVATATIALQRQLVDRDLPRLVESIGSALPRTPSFAILKGRRNYLCLQRFHAGPEDEQTELFDSDGKPPSPTSSLGLEIARLGDWANRTESGDRDELVP